MIQRTINSSKIIIKIGIIDIIFPEKSIKKLLDKNSSKNCFIGVYSLKPISSLNQVFFAFFHSIKAFEQKTSFSNNLNLEFLTRVTGERQINKALKEMKLKKGKNEIMLIGWGKEKNKVLDSLKKAEKELNFKEEKNLLEKNLKKNFNYLKRLFKIKEKELKVLDKNKFKGLEKGIIERIALVELKD